MDKMGRMGGTHPSIHPPIHLPIYPSYPSYPVYPTYPTYPVKKKGLSKPPIMLPDFDHFYPWSKNLSFYCCFDR